MNALLFATSKGNTEEYFLE